MAHLCSLTAAKAGKLALGLKMVIKGLWSLKACGQLLRETFSCNCNELKLVWMTAVVSMFEMQFHKFWTTSTLNCFVRVD